MAFPDKPWTTIKKNSHRALKGSWVRPSPWSKITDKGIIPNIICNFFTELVRTLKNNRERETTEKELERVIENKGDEFLRKKNMEIQSGGEKMRNASDQQGENERQWKIKANMNTGDKILSKHIRQFLHENNV